MNLLYLTILFPLLSFFILAFSRGYWSKNFTTIVGIGSIGLAALTTIWLAINFSSMVRNDNIFMFTQTLWCWIAIDHFNIPVTLSLDGLSLTMLSVIIGVGLLIQLYASWYLHKSEGYSRFFAYTNLFIANMVMLVLADNLLLMYFAWEGVGLCSYLLIGFYYTNYKNSAAAIKAFVITRIGDVFLLFAIFIFYHQFNTLNFHQLTLLSSQQLAAVHSPIVVWAILMLLIGSVGKSAQLPLQTWLSDAMVGPTPVSALIHAATMVTVGVYLIARTHALFLIAPDILYIAGIIGSITLLLASCTALVQTDIKKILAYSTMSQIGYMFLALGVQGWHAAIYHLTTHAFFKALLFLSAGSLILACQGEQNIFKMGGLRKSNSLVYVCFLAGGASLSALPLVTSGFYSKDAILWNALVNGHRVLLLVGLIGSLLTSIYTFRMIFIVFHGKKKINALFCHGGINHQLPLILLLVLSTFIGAFITLPLSGVFPNSNLTHDGQIKLELISGMITILGIGIAAVLWLGKHNMVNTIKVSTLGSFFSVWWFNAWGFDWLYKQIFIKPYLMIARLLEKDPLGALMNIPPAQLVGLAARVLTLSVNGKLRWYIASIEIGAIIVIILLLI